MAVHPATTDGVVVAPSVDKLLKVTAIIDIHQQLLRQQHIQQLELPDIHVHVDIITTYQEGPPQQAITTPMVDGITFLQERTLAIAYVHVDIVIKMYKHIQFYITSLVVATFHRDAVLAQDTAVVRPLVLLHTMAGRTIITWCAESQSE